MIRSPSGRSLASSLMAGHDAIDGAKVQLNRMIVVIGSSGDLKKPFTAESAENDRRERAERLLTAKGAKRSRKGRKDK
jgi:hypothetical protein